MIERPQTATLYVWQKEQSFNMDYLVFILGGSRPLPNDKIDVIQYGKPVYYTDEFRIYPVTKEQDDLAYDIYNKVKPFHPYFRTVMLENRMIDLGLPVPDVEVVFCRRDPLNIDGIDAQKVRAAAAHLSVYCGFDVLCVPNTTIEQDQYFASGSIANKLGIPMVPE